ncbi:hypothetical protein NliqN6_0554 [Naganishia liquefaciens]|uniref:Uncharacterized protein n=1 Tax=Naganishia liquefaciens TaxID=104408 RepID=A0A8H3TN40_9TREE|nr:hypothetical protein NliqN6_0554 [Naganishia liquefaciens]
MEASVDPKMEAFRTLKPLCVPLMGLRPLTAQTQAIAHTHLVRLLTALRSLPNPKDAFTPSLVRYTLFPLSHLLTRNNPAGRKEGEVGYIADRTLEVLFECITWIMQRWLEDVEEVDARIWEQLWRMVVLILGGPIGSDSRLRPHRAEETIEAGVELLGVLVCSPPSEDMRNAVFGPGRRLLPVLFHAISTLIDIATSATSSQVIQRALQILESILVNWFADDDKARVLAGVMPGIISAIVKIISGAPSVAQSRGMQTVWNDVNASKQTSSRKPPTTDIACAALQLFSSVVVLTIGDVPLTACGVLAAQVFDLESLVNDINVNEADDSTLVGSPTLSASSTQTLQNRADPFPQLTATYLAYTRTQLMHSLHALLPTLTTHHALRVRLALVDALSRIAQSCVRSLDSDESAVQDILLTTLLELGSPYESSPGVSSHARMAICGWLQERQVQSRLRAILERELGAFPAAVQSHSERRVGSCVNVIMALTSLAREVNAGALRRDFALLLGSNGGVVRWSWPLLACLELARPVEMETEQANDGTTRAWDLARIEGSSMTDSMSGGAPAEAFPRMTLVHVESRIMTERIAGMLEALGGAAGASGVATVEQLLTFASARRGGAVASAALWVVGKIVNGLARPVSADEKRVRRAARRIVDFIVDSDEAGELPLDTSAEPSTEVMTVERRRGLDTISKLLDDSKRTPIAATDSSRRAHAAIHRELVTCLHLSLLASCAHILSTSFRRHLDATLYIILSHLGSPHAFVRRHAQVALAQISYHAGYASAQNLILDNVDYVINRVSQRMTYDRLDTLAPMVLISMVKLVGEPIVPLVQDIIADIFDALDDFHGYALLASTVLAVMDTLMKAMAAEVPAANTVKGTTSTSVRMRRAPDPARDFATFTSWYADRAAKARQTMDELLERAPVEPWDRPKDAQEAANEGPSNASADTETPPTRAQEVCIQMMQKSIYFLTHANPFIAARVLSLFASGVPVLISQERESDALPLIHVAWPSVLNRLQDPTPFVRTEAAALVECLARWTGDFMSRRILDDAWPIFRQLLAEQKQRDEHSALAKRGVRGTTSAHTVSHRLYLSVIHAMHLVTEKVPIADDLFWEIILALRPFLDARVHPELAGAAVKIYRSMAERDEDAVWLALHATIGTVIADQPLPTYLREPGMDIRHSVELVV